MNLDNGQIEYFSPDQKPTLNHIELSPIEEKILGRFPEEVRPFELLWLRTHKSLKWDFIKAAQRKEAFRHGWNAAVFAKAQAYVISEKDAQATK